MDIVETKVVPEEDRVRAKTANGQWMSLINTSNGFEWASPVPLGAYKLKKVADLAVDFRITSPRSTTGPLQVGDIVEIIETKVVPEDKRVRAKISMGLWMSLVNTDDGSVWAKPRKIVEAEEAQQAEEARDLGAVQDWRTCLCLAMALIIGSSYTLLKLYFIQS